MCLFRNKDREALVKEVCGIRFSNPAGVAFPAGTPLPPANNRILAGFITLNPPKEDVLKWISGLQAFREKTVLGVNLSSDIMRNFALVYDFADFIVIDPDTDSGIDSPDLGDSAQLISEIVSQRLCYESYTPVLLRISHAVTPQELNPLLSVCQLYGIDGAIVHGSRKMSMAMELTKGRLPIVGVAENAQEAQELLDNGAVLVETQLRPLPFVKLLKTLEKQAKEKV